MLVHLDGIPYSDYHDCKISFPNWSEKLLSVIALELVLELEEGHFGKSLDMAENILSIITSVILTEFLSQ